MLESVCHVNIQGCTRVAHSLMIRILGLDILVVGERMLLLCVPYKHCTSKAPMSGNGLAF